MEIKQFLNETAERTMEIELNLTGKDVKHRNKVDRLVDNCYNLGWITEEEQVGYKEKLLSLEK